MSSNGFLPSGFDSFWEQADRDASSEHPLERELCDRIDALARYRRLIEDAQANGWDEAADTLIEQHRREEDIVQRLNHAIRRMRDGGAAA